MFLEQGLFLSHWKLGTGCWRLLNVTSCCDNGGYYNIHQNLGCCDRIYKQTNTLSYSHNLLHFQRQESGKVASSANTAWNCQKMVSVLHKIFSSSLKINTITYSDQKHGIIIPCQKLTISTASIRKHSLCSHKFRETVATLSDLKLLQCPNLPMLELRRSFSTTRGKSLPIIYLFTKEGCTLCDEAKEVLRPYRHRFTLEEVDITLSENADWYKKYKYDIPVFHMYEEFLFMHKVDLGIIEQALKLHEEKHGKPME